MLLYYAYIANLDEIVSYCIADCFDTFHELLRSYTCVVPVLLMHDNECCHNNQV